MTKPVQHTIGVLEPAGVDGIVALNPVSVFYLGAHFEDLVSETKDGFGPLATMHGPLVVI